MHHRFNGSSGWFLQKCEALEAQLLAAAAKISEIQTVAAAAQDDAERQRKKLSEVTQDKDAHFKVGPSTFQFLPLTCWQSLH